MSRFRSLNNGILITAETSARLYEKRINPLFSLNFSYFFTHTLCFLSKQYLILPTERKIRVAANPHTPSATHYQYLNNI